MTMKPTTIFLITLSLAFVLGAQAADEARPAQQAGGKAKKEQPFTPGGKWRAHDMKRPLPRVVDAGGADAHMMPSPPPSDAIILFDGNDLSKWFRTPRKDDPDKSDAPKWKIENGYMEIVPRSGSLTTKEKFGSCQLHVEWATPAEVKGDSQGRGNSGFFILGHPEIQVLDSHGNKTYADGSAAALYGQYPPLVNVSRKPGEWQSYDVIYEAPQFEGGKMVKPAYYTVFHNGVLVHNHVEVPGIAVECPISLQDHLNPVRYRNIWLRKLTAHDAP